MLRCDGGQLQDPEAARDKILFDNLTPLYPEEKIHLEVDGDVQNYSSRVMDLPDSDRQGQRGLIVASPRTGQDHAATEYCSQYYDQS